ncbi:MAG: helix-turn-helix domain-containing protein [Candidatus Aenigmatarchaeota archaeon]
MYCVVARTFQLIGKKWTLHVLKILHLSKTKRFNQLLNEIKGISPRTLSQRLKDLEKNGFVKRVLFNEIPPKVEYSLTEEGKKIAGCFGSEGLCKQHKECIFMKK